MECKKCKNKFSEAGNIRDYKIICLYCESEKEIIEEEEYEDEFKDGS